MKFWVIKNVATGEYWRASQQASTAPTLYMTAGKAMGRRKQIRGDGWQVIEWTVTESPLVQKSH